MSRAACSATSVPALRCHRLLSSTRGFWIVDQYRVPSNSGARIGIHQVSGSARSVACQEIWLYGPVVKYALSCDMISRHGSSVMDMKSGCMSPSAHACRRMSIMPR